MMRRLLALLLSSSLMACGGTADHETPNDNPGSPLLSDLKICEGDFWFSSSMEGWLAANPEFVGAPNSSAIDDVEDGSIKALIDVVECQHITGNVRLNNSVSLQELSFLSQLVSIGGRLDIRYNESLSSLKGLENLNNVGGEIFIAANPKLLSIDAISHLQQAGSIVIINNDALEDVKLWANPMSTTEGGLSFHSNAALKRVDLNEITSIAGTLNFYNNSSLEEIHVSDSLTSIGYDLGVHANPLLSTIDGFVALNTLGRDLTVYDNSKLANFAATAFAPLTATGGDLVFRNNPELLRLPMLDKLTRVGGKLIIKNNPRLTQLDSFKQLQSINQLLEVSENAELSSITTFSELNDADIAFLNLTNLEQLPAFNKLKRLSNLYLVGNPKLNDLTGLDSLEYVWGNVVLANQLQSLEGLGALTRIDAGLAIMEPMLEEYDGFWALQSIGRLLLHPSTEYLSEDEQQAFAESFIVRMNIGKPNQYSLDDICIGSISNFGDESGLTTPLVSNGLTEFSHCKVITGSLEVFAQSRAVWEPPYLSPLNNLTEVWGDLNIAMDIFDELDEPADGFPSLMWIGGDLSFSGTLSKFDFLPQLKRLDGFMHFEFIDDWSAIPTFENLQSN